MTRAGDESIDAIAFTETHVNATLAKSATLPFSLFAGSTEVVPAIDTVSCTSANPLVVTVWTGSIGALGDDSSGLAVVDAHASGTTTITCTAGSHAATAAVTVP